MAAYFTDLRDQDYVWNVGELVPVSLIFGKCKEVQADGDELEYIELTIDPPKGEGKRVVTWTDAVAQSIYDTLLTKG